MAELTGPPRDDRALMPRPRIFSGMRPTGPLHLGHLTGALDNWVRLMEPYDCFFAVVDWHALTTEYADPSAVRENVLEVAIDWLAAGLNRTPAPGSDSRTWCRRRDSNPHGFPHTPLKRACLPIPPLRHGRVGPKHRF